MFQTATSRSVLSALVLPLTCGIWPCVLVRADNRSSRQATPAPHSLNRAGRPTPTPAALSPEAASRLLGGPTLLTMSFRGATANTVAAAMLRAAHLPPQVAVVSGTTPQSSVTVNWRGVPFWTAAREIEQQTGLAWDERRDYFGDTPFTIALSSEPQRMGLMGRVGVQTPLITLVANNISRQTNRTQSIRIGESGSQLLPESSASSYLNLNLSAFFDPKVHLVPDSVKLTISDVLDENSHTIQNVQSNDLSEFRSSHLIIHPGVYLPATLRPGSTVKQLRGRLNALIILGTQTWRVLSTTRNASRRVGRGTYTVQNAVLAQDSLSVSLRYSGPSLGMQGQLTSSSSGSGVTGIPQAVLNVRLRDARGREVEASGASVNGSGTPNRYQYDANIAFPLRRWRDNVRLQGPFTLVWDIPTEVRALEAPFEFRDLPIP